MLHKLTLLLFLLISSEAFADKLKVGVIAGFSGPWSSYGAAYQKGFELADVENNIEFIYEDDQFAPAKTVAAFHKLVEESKVDLIVVGDTVTSTAIAPLALKLKIPTLVWASKEAVFLNNSYIIRLGPTPESEFTETAKFLNANSTGSLQVIVHPHSYSSMWGKEVFTRYQEKNKEIIELPETQQDFKSLILKIKSNKFENLALCLNPGDNGIFIKQLQQLNYQAKIFACNFIEATADLEAIQSYPDPILFFAPELNDDFIKKYSAMNPLQDHFVSVALMYDVAKILNLVQQNKEDIDLVRKILNLTSYPSAHQSYNLVTTTEDQYLDIPTALFQIDHGKISQID